MMSQCPPPSAGAQGSQSSTQSYRNRMELVKTRVSRLSSHVMIGQIQAVCPNSHDSRGFPALFQLDPPCLPPNPREDSLLAQSAGVFHKILVPGMALEQWFLENAVVPRECGSSSGALPLQVYGARRAAGVWHMEPSPEKRERPTGCGAHWTLLLATQGSTWAMEQEAGEGSRQVIPDPPGPSRPGAALTSV